MSHFGLVPVYEVRKRLLETKKNTLWAEEKPPDLTSDAHTGISTGRDRKGRRRHRYLGGFRPYSLPSGMIPDPFPL
jgi:hypothetical protein